MRRDAHAIVLFHVEGVVFPEDSKIIYHILFGSRT